jgi:EAL domain-containing protein (putative c-di-GMP-specific phosphodiesterase class I)
VEGIETPEMLALARESGFEAVQGYFLERPLGADAFTTKFKAERGSFLAAE